MSRKKKIILIVAGSLLLLVFLGVLPLLLRARANNALAEELRPEFDKWLATLPQIPDEENGALVIVKGLNSFTDMPDEYYEVLEEDLVEDAELIKIMKKHLEENGDALRLVEEGLKYEKWLYTVDYSAGFDATLPYMNISNCKDSFVLRGQYAGMDGQHSKALEDYLKLLKLGTTLAEGRFFVSGLVEIAVYTTAQQKLIPLLASGRIEEHELDETFETLLRLYKSRGNYADRMESEAQIFFKLVVDCIDNNRSIEDFINMRTPIKFPAKYLYDFRPSVEIYRKSRDIQVKLDPSKYYEQGKRFEDDDAYFKELGLDRTSARISLAGLVLPAVIKCYEKFVISETYWRASIVVAAIKLFEKRNGRLPANLDELGGLVPKELLIDPFSGKMLVYRLKGENDFCLYSVGVDGIDSKCEDTRELFDVRQREDEPDDIIFHAPPKKDEDE